MKAKSGKLVSIVEPTKPEEAFEADEAKPVKVAEVKAKQVEQKKGKYGSTITPPFKPIEAQTDKEKEETTWIEIELLDEEDKPVSGEKYEVELPDGTMAKGTLDGNGFAKVDGIESGECKVSFPELDKDAWAKA